MEKRSWNPVNLDFCYKTARISYSYTSKLNYYELCVVLYRWERVPRARTWCAPQLKEVSIKSADFS